jgi:hypothetical protein
MPGWVTGDTRWWVLVGTFFGPCAGRIRADTGVGGTSSEIADPFILRLTTPGALYIGGRINAGVEEGGRSGLAARAFCAGVTVAGATASNTCEATPPSVFRLLAAFPSTGIRRSVANHAVLEKDCSVDRRLLA